MSSLYARLCRTVTSTFPIMTFCCPFPMLLSQHCDKYSYPRTYSYSQGSGTPSTKGQMELTARDQEHPPQRELIATVRDQEHPTQRELIPSARDQEHLHKGSLQLQPGIRNTLHKGNLKLQPGIRKIFHKGTKGTYTHSQGSGICSTKGTYSQGSGIPSTKGTYTHSQGSGIPSTKGTYTHSQILEIPFTKGSYTHSQRLETPFTKGSYTHSQRLETSPQRELTLTAIDWITLHKGNLHPQPEIGNTLHKGTKGTYSHNWRSGTLSAKQ